MVRVALCGHISLQQEASVEQLLDDCARKTEQLEVVSFSNPTDLVVACSHAEEEHELIDLVVSAYTLAGINGMQLAGELMQANTPSRNVRMILCAPDASRARDAAALGISAYLLEPVAPERLVNVLDRLISEIREEHESSAVMRCRDGLQRIGFSQLSFVETSGRDQLVHRAMGEPVAVRCSSRAMYAYLEGDPRFYKLGSSFIINLDYVTSLSLRNGVVTMRDGTQVNAPVRLRKPLAEALCAHAVVAI